MDNRSKKSETTNNHLYTYSCLINPASLDSIKKIFSKSTWEVRSNFGQSHLNQFADDSWEFSSGDKYVLDGITFRAFVTHRYFDQYQDPRFELLQPFLFYHNAFWVSEKSEFQHVDQKNGDVITLVKHNIISDKEEEILINASLLRNYLAITRSFLIRFHDHRRFSTKKIELTNKEVNSSGEYYNYNIYTDDSLLGDKKVLSRLLGKDVVKPFNTPDLKEGLYEYDDDEYVLFIIGKDENGQDIEVTCNEKYLSSYFEEKKEVHYLTPVYFNRSLLTKYYSEPKKYKVTESTISCLSIWQIEYDTNSEGLIQVWLGDLGRSFSPREQQYWRQFNVLPKGTITKHRWAADFEVKFVDPSFEERPIQNLKFLYESINNTYKNKYDQKLFKELKKEDMYLYDTLRIPVTTEWKEFDEQIQALAKIFVDSLNIKFLESVTGKKIGNGEIRGSISLFKQYLIRQEYATEVIEKVINSLSMIQNLRSSSSAHRKGKAFYKLLNKYELANTSNDIKIRKVLSSIYFSLQTLEHK